MIKAIIFAIFGLVGSSRLSTHEATAEELALIDYVIDNGGMVRRNRCHYLDLLQFFGFAMLGMRST